MTESWCVEKYIDNYIKERNNIIYELYPDVSVIELSQKFKLNPMYILFILKRMGKELLPQHETKIQPYVTNEYPFPHEGNGYIYKIVNDIDNMVYIGQTANSLLLRFKEHIREYHESCGTRKLHQHFSLIGTEHFHIELIEEVPLKDLNEREKYWIAKYNSFYCGLNGTLGGDYDRQEFF